MLDLHLAIAHHLLVFGLFGVLFAELVGVRRGMTAIEALRLSRVDLWYGVLAGLILLVGFARAYLVGKGWEFYSHNAFFWAKIGSFAGIGVLSVPPTMALIRWRRLRIAPDDGEIGYVRKFIWAEMALFAVLLACAAAMARGHGQM